MSVVAHDTGAATVGVRRIAIVREVGDELAACELSFVERTPIDPTLARGQHHAYAEALREAGCEVLRLPALQGYPDAVFVEDAALVLDEVAVLTRPGAASRRGEIATIEAALRPYRDVLRIESPATLDGGDILRIGRSIFIGQGARSNADAVMQLQALLHPHGYRVQGVPTRDCLHLKSAVTQVADETVLVNPAWLRDATPFERYRHIAIDPAEPHAANALRIGDTIVHPACFPRTRRRLQAAGIHVVALDLSELQKAEGATTCCSLVFEA